jgi:hypothetical protein
MKLDIPTSLLVCYLARLLIFGASIGDALVLTALTGLFGFIHFLNSKKQPDINAEIKTELETIKKEFVDVKNKVNVITIGTQFRSR